MSLGVLRILQLEPIRTHGLSNEATLIARFMGPTWGPSGADRTQVDPMLPPWTLPSHLGNNSMQHTTLPPLASNMHNPVYSPVAPQDVIYISVAANWNVKYYGATVLRFWYDYTSDVCICPYAYIRIRAKEVKWDVIMWCNQFTVTMALWNIL